MAPVVVLIVGYRNAEDIGDCLGALARLAPEPGFDVYIAENGGPAGFDALVARLDAGAGAWERSEAVAPVAPEDGRRSRAFRLTGRGNGGSVFVAEMADNLGYAGGINAWLRPLLGLPGWRAAWVLNPDTQPARQALAELADYARRFGKGMVASAIARGENPAVLITRGLRWEPWAGRAKAIGRGAATAEEPDARAVEALLTAPSGASVFVTRELIERIGLMDESYFLYFEDLEWGERARRLGAIGYAHGSVVPHKAGTTIGSAADRKRRSPLSVYLTARNTIRFVTRNYPLWLAWTVAIQLAQVAAYFTAGAADNGRVALSGLRAGLRDETGKPDIALSAARGGDLTRQGL